MNTRLKALIIIFILAGLYAAYYFVVPILIDIKSKTSEIQSLVKKELGVDIELSNPSLKMGLLPSIWVDASSFSVIEKDKTHSFKVQNPKIKVLLLPLIAGKIKLAYFSCDNLYLKLKFDKNLRFYLGKHLFIENANSIISIENSKMNINKYKIDINDEFQGKNILLEGNYFELLKFNSKKRIKFSIDSKMRVNKRYSIINGQIDVNLPFKKNFKSNKLFVDGTITNFDLADISPYIRKFSKNSIKRTSGLVNIESKTQKLNSKTNRITSSMVLENLNIIGKDAASSVVFNDKLTTHAILNVTNNTLIFHKFQVLSNKINLNISGEISKIKSKKPNFDLSIIIKDSRTEDLVSLIPAKSANLEGVNLVALKKYGLFSNLNGKLQIKGKSDYPTIYGKLFATEAYVIKPLSGNIPKATVKLNFLGEKMHMDIHVPTSTIENVDIIGTVELIGEKNSDIQVKSTSSVDIKTVQTILNPVHEIFNFELGPLPVLDIIGIGNINLKILGNKENPHLTGVANFINSQVKYSGLAVIITKLNGVLKFEDNQIRFYTKSALLNNKIINVDGLSSLKGDLDYKIQTNNQELPIIIDQFNKSEMLKDVQKMFSQIKTSSGKIDLNINLTGKVKSIEDFKLGQTVLLKGKIKLLGNNITIDKFIFPIQNASGDIDFNNTDFCMNLISTFNSSKLSINGEVKNNIANINIDSNSLNLEEVLHSTYKDNEKKNKKYPTLLSGNASVSGNYKGPIDKIELNNVNFNGKIINPKYINTDLVLTSGDFEFNNSTLYLSKIIGSFKKNQFHATVKIKNIFQKNQIINGNFESDNFDVSVLNTIAQYPFLNSDFRKQIGKYSNTNGLINLKVKADNNIISSRIKLNDIKFLYEPLQLPIKIHSGVAEFKNNRVNLYNINSTVDSMPLLVDGVISNIFTNQNFNIYVNSKPTQNFIEKYINTKAIYPLKIKGDIIYSARLHGTKDNFNAKTTVTLEKDSNIYYMGSTLGDTNVPIRLLINADVLKDSINLINFRYQKLISSQNNKVFVSSQLSAQGRIIINGTNISLNNFGIKTQNPTDAKIFNILFKKPMIKQGQFTSNIFINGPISSPYLKGDLNFTGINIPLLDTTIKDISLKFKDKIIDINTNGEIFSNKLIINSAMENNLKPPYIFENIDISLENLNINKITKSLNNLEIEKDKHKLSDEKQPFNISDIIVKNAQVKADSVSIKNIYAKNLFANLSLNEKLVFFVDKFQFDIADGKVKGEFKYNILNSFSNLEMVINNVNANEISDALFDLPDQIYGSLTGEVALSCNGKSHKSCMNTLSGRGGFTVNDGRMPKLGSMEYLLKATNLVKSGVTGLSINGIIDLITPLKTGQLEMINGSFYIDSGIANSIQIFSKGKDLSLFISGTYNFSTLIADMNIFGRLSKKISTVLGPIGNASLNTLFNTIPGLNLDDENNAQFIKDINKIPGFELNDKTYRIFNAKIYGDINGDDYVQSFRWVE